MKLLWLKYYNALKKRVLLILVIALLAVTTSGYMSYKVVVPSYTASAKVIVNVKPTIDPNMVVNELAADQRLLKTYTEILKSNSLMQDVISRMELKISADALSAKVSVAMVTDTNIIAITATDSDPKQVSLIADEVAMAFVNKAARLMQVDNVILLDKAIDRPPAKINPKPKVSMMVAAMLSVTVGAGLFIILEYFDPTLKTKLEVQGILRLPAIGEIGRWEQSQARRSGGSRRRFFWQRKGEEDFITPLNMASSKRNRAVLDNYQELYRNLLPFQMVQQLKTIAVTSTMRREGKSALLTHFGILLAQKGQRVLLIDAELDQPALHEVFKIPNDIGLCDVLTGRADLAVAAAHSPIQGLDVLPTGSVTTAAGQRIGTPAFKELLEAAGKRYDVVLIDCAAIAESIVPLTIAKDVDSVLFVVGCGQVQRQHAVLAAEALLGTGANVVGAVLNTLEGKRVRSKFFLDRIGQQLTVARSKTEHA
jgi:polysaccharide biosynthesis transport protein